MDKAVFHADVRNDFLLDRAVAFLNHGSFGATPKVVLAEQAVWRERLEREPVDFFVNVLPKALRTVADELGQVLGTDGANLVWVDNASTGTATVLASLTFTPGDSIVATSHGYGAVLRQLDHVAARTGVQLIQATIPFPIRDPSEVVAAVAAAIAPNTRLLVIDHVTSFSGLVYPVAELVALAHERGIKVLVDGAHAPGMLPLHLDSLEADWYVGNCHKWLFTPKGCAFLYARPDRQMIHPLVVSHSYNAGFIAEFDFTGTRDPSPWLSLPAALGYVRGFGIENIRSHNDFLAAVEGQQLAESLGVAIPSPGGMRASLCTLPIPGEATPGRSERIGRMLYEKYLVQVPLWTMGGQIWLRISAQIHNQPSDYARLRAAVPDILACV